MVLWDYVVFKMVGLFVYMTSELAGPLYSSIDVEPFRSQNYSCSLIPVNGMSTSMTFFEELKSPIELINFISSEKLLG